MIWDSTRIRDWRVRNKIDTTPTSEVVSRALPVTVGEVKLAEHHGDCQ